MPRDRRHLTRERNQRGFIPFLRNLKSVISLFRSVPDLELGLNSFEESRSRLVDARGTLTLIIDDISFGRESVSSQCYGASSEQIRALLISLKNSVNEMIELIMTGQRKTTQWIMLMEHTQHQLFVVNMDLADLEFL